MSSESKALDWSKPAAMAIPKGGYFQDKVEQGRYGPIFPKTPACYGFSILAKIIAGRPCSTLSWKYPPFGIAIAAGFDQSCVLESLDIVLVLAWCVFSMKVLMSAGSTAGGCPA